MKYHTAFKTIVFQEILRLGRTWIQTIVPPIITMTLYFVIFGTLIGSQLSEIKGMTYMQYLVPGLVMMTTINSSYANVVSSFYGARFQKNIEEILVSPVPNYLILLGFVSGGVLRGMILGFAVALISLLFTHIYIHHLALMLATALLCSLLFALGGFANAVFARNFDDISVVPNFVLTPLTYLGGVFYSIDQLPPFWHKISLFNPILYMVNAFRYGMLGITDVSIFLAITIILSLIALLFAFNLHLLNKGVGLKS